MLDPRARPLQAAACTLAAVLAAGAQEARSRALVRELTAAPRLAGTCGSVWGARVAARVLEQAGWRVELDRREVLLSLPRRIELAVFADADASVASLTERVEVFDARALPPGDVPMFNAWAKSGSVRAPVVDAGYGSRAELEALDLRGKIALVRYGKGYRGGKVERAAERGAVGVLIFSDPADDGDERGATWPAGPWKQDSDAQRGSILSVARAPGDPSTPGFPSPAPGETPIAQRLEGAELEAVLPRVPCTPISVREARAILAQLSGKEGGPCEVRIALDQPRELFSIVNVIATLEGAEPEFVLAGGHRDSWVRGAHDNAGGTVALLRAAELLGARARAGWKPSATLRIALWDAEESGLIGSTEWAEAHARELAQRCLVYLNCDANCGGTRFSASGSPGLVGALRGVLEGIQAPVPASDGADESLWQQWSARFDDGAPHLSLPGSGSDHAVFAHHLALPVLELGFGGNPGGQYHTRADDFAMVDRWLDPQWLAHEKLALVLAAYLARASELGRALYDPREAARELARLARLAGSEGEMPWLAPERAERLARAFELAPELDLRACVVPGGLAGRPWFRNALWAPELDNGYGSETFPTLRATADDAAHERALAELCALVAGGSAGGERP